LNQSKLLAEIFLKSWEGTLNQEEEAYLQQWLALSPKNREYYERKTKEYTLKHLQQFEKNDPGSQESLLATNSEGQNEGAAPNPKRRSFAKAACVVVVSIAVAACIILIFKIRRSGSDPHNLIELQLADGSRIYPETIREHILINEGDFRIMVNNKELRYLALPGNSSGKDWNAYNAIRIPAGKQFPVIFPDGSNVFLNAVSTMRYPVSGAGGIRNVELTGEAYFDIQSLYVGKNKIPFVVKVRTPQGLEQEVTVTGTKFNINAYGDANTIRTTLFDGQVKVVSSGKAIWLSQGEECIVEKTRSYKPKNSNYINNAIAWKDSLFVFDDQPMQLIAKELSRWYDLEVEARETSTAPVSYVGPRSQNIQEIMKAICSMYKYSYSMEGNGVILIRDR
jgi:ferric-dicitrate binding protein FerR (iron transport regulator)